MGQTGTLTKGEPEVTGVTEGMGSDELLQRVAAVERESEHRIACAVVAHCDESRSARPSASKFESRGPPVRRRQLAAAAARTPQVGLLDSTDGGQTWQVRSAQAGRSFMGTILVDPKDPNRLIGVDMAVGLTARADGGRT